MCYEATVAINIMASGRRALFNATKASIRLPVAPTLRGYY
jgi:hypothetical protein